MIQREKLRLHTSSWHKETTISHKVIHKKHLISQLKDYSVEPFENSNYWSRNQFFLVQSLFETSELGNEKYLDSVKERLVEGEKLIYHPMSNSNIKN